MVVLVDLARGREIHLGLDLNEEPTEGNDVDDQPTPRMKLPQARKYAQLLSNFTVEHPLDLSVVDVMNMQSFMDASNKMSISSIIKHHQKAIDSYFRSMQYGEGIIVGTM